MQAIDFDFAKYVAHRKGLVEQRARDGSAYSYAGERKVRRALTSTRPVSIAIEGTTRLWKGSAKSELLEISQRATDVARSEVFRAGQRAAAALGVKVPAIYVVQPSETRITSRALGTDDDAYIFLAESLVDRLDDDELTAILGHEIGHIQNNHVVYSTALFYLRHEAMFFVRWIVQPAIIALQAWSRRAEVTCDRAALLAVRDLDHTLSAIVKSVRLDASNEDVAAYLSDIGSHEKAGLARYMELFRTYPQLPKRLKALSLFAESRLYKVLCDKDAEGGLSADEVDSKVSEILSVF